MIQVLQPGLLTSVQDEGRAGYLAFGMPRAGVMDRYAARMANLLCSNPFSAAVLEMTLIGGSFKFEQACRIAVCGADMQLKLNGRIMSGWAAMDVAATDVLEIGPATAGCRCYLAVSGGLDVPLVMESRSTYGRAGIGGVAGRALKAGDTIPLGEAIPLPMPPVGVPVAWIPQYSSEIEVRVLLGPQDALFTPQGVATFLSASYSVSDDVDRMGYRLSGPVIEHVQGADIISDALAPGAVQVPGSGQPIVMMVDCGTTGGYAKIATVISTDLAKLAQTQPQDQVKFIQCTDDEAVRAYREEMNRYRQVAALVAKSKPTDTETPKDGRRMVLQIAGQLYQVEIEEVK